MSGFQIAVSSIFSHESVGIPGERERVRESQRGSSSMPILSVGSTQLPPEVLIPDSSIRGLVCQHTHCRRLCTSGPPQAVIAWVLVLLLLTIPQTGYIVKKKVYFSSKFWFKVEKPHLVLSLMAEFQGVGTSNDKSWEQLWRKRGASQGRSGWLVKAHSLKKHSRPVREYQSLMG